MEYAIRHPNGRPLYDEPHFSALARVPLIRAANAREAVQFAADYRRRRGRPCEAVQRASADDPWTPIPQPGGLGVEIAAIEAALPDLGAHRDPKDLTSRGRGAGGRFVSLDGE